MKNITIKFSAKAEKQLRKIPEKIINKLEKQIDFLIKDISHPSLRVKKKQGDSSVWEARIDYHYRFAFLVEEYKITIISVGPHDTGLGKK